MPKGHREPREFNCRACGSTFTSTKVGKATWYCQSEECDKARGVTASKRRHRERRADPEVTRRLQLQAEQERVERDRERDDREQRRREEAARARDQRDRQQRQAVAQAKRQQAIEARMRKKGLEMFAPIFDAPNQMLMVDDILEVVELASTTPVSATELKKAQTALKNAQGVRQRHQAAQRLAALFLRLSDHWRPRVEPREVRPVSEEPVAIGA